MYRFILLIALAILQPLCSFAIPITWTGATNADWHTASNWSPAQVPTASDDVQIISTPSTNSINILQDSYCRSLVLDGATVIMADNHLVVTDKVPGQTSSLIMRNAANLTLFTVGTTLQVTGTMTLKDFSGISNNGGIIVNGNLAFTYVHIILEDFSEILNNPGASIICGNNIEPGGGDRKTAFITLNNNCRLDNYGTLDLYYTASSNDYVNKGIIVSNSSTLFNASIITIEKVEFTGIEVFNGSLGSLLSRIENYGTIQVDGCVTCGGGGLGIDIGQEGKFFDNPSSAPIYQLVFNDMNINIQNSSCVVFNAPPSTPFSLTNLISTPGSILAGSGPVDNCCSMVQGTISPGFSPGIMEFLAPFNVTDPTKFAMELAGTNGPGSATGHDQIIFTGATNDLTNISLDVKFIDGFVPNVGNSFTLLTGVYTGTFENINFQGSNESWSINYNANDITIELLTEVTNIDNVGIGTSIPESKLQVAGGDIYVGTQGSGIILKDANGNCRRITINGAGVISAPIVSCPDEQN